MSSALVSHCRTLTPSNQLIVSAVTPPSTFHLGQQPGFQGRGAIAYLWRWRLCRWGRGRSRSSQDSNPTCLPSVADHHRPDSLGVAQVTSPGRSYFRCSEVIFEGVYVCSTCGGNDAGVSFRGDEHDAFTIAVRKTRRLITGPGSANRSGRGWRPWRLRARRHVRTARGGVRRCAAPTR